MYGPSTLTREKVTFGAVPAVAGAVLPPPETPGGAGLAVAAGAADAAGAAEGDAVGVWPHAAASEKSRTKKNTGRAMSAREEAYGGARGMQK